MKTKSRPSRHRLWALAFVCTSRRSATIQRCNLIGRRLCERFVSQKHHLPSSLRTLRTTLTVCRVQSMSCHFSPKYSLGRIPVVSATASTGPFSWQSSFYKCLRLLYAHAFRPLDCCGILNHRQGSQAADATAMPAAWQTLILRVYSGRFERIVPTQSFADK